MTIEARRQVRLELRIRRPASDQDWTVRKIEWLEPAGVVIAARAEDPEAAPTLATDLHPRDEKGCWFAGGANLWALYPRQNQPAHHVRLRVTVKRPGERARKLLVTSAFPAMDWASPALASPRRRAPVEASLREARTWQTSDWDGTGTPGLA